MKMKFKDRLKRLLRGQMPVTILFIVLGLCLVFLPAGTLNILCKVVFGLALVLTGLYHVFLQVFERPGRDVSVPDLYTGVITMVIGLFLFTNSQLVVKLLPWMLGGFVVADCIWMVKGSLRMKKLKVNFYKVLLAGAIIFAVAGCVLIFFPFRQVSTLLLFAGWLFLIKGVSDIFLYIRGRKLLTAAEAKAVMKPRYKMMTMREDYQGDIPSQAQTPMDAPYQEVQPEPEPVIYQGTAEETPVETADTFDEVDEPIQAPWEKAPEDFNEEETGE